MVFIWSVKHEAVETTEVHSEECTGTRELWPGLVDSSRLYRKWDRNPGFIFITNRFTIQAWGMCTCVTLDEVAYFYFVHLHTHHIRLLCLHLATDHQILPPSAVFHYVQRAVDAFIPEQTPCVRGRWQLIKGGGPPPPLSPGTDSLSLHTE